MKDFIGVYEDAASNDFCDEVIKFYEDCEKLNKTVPRRVNGYHQQHADNDILSAYQIGNSNVLMPWPLIQKFGEFVWASYGEYAKEYNTMEGMMRHKLNPDVMIQKIKPSQGYHGWHCENSGIEYGRRLLAVMLYLNDVEEGGETEFLYQSRRVYPKKGSVILHPASFTHTHRGNPPLSSDKYVMNGWIEFVE